LRAVQPCLPRGQDRAKLEDRKNEKKKPGVAAAAINL